MLIFYAMSASVWEDCGNRLLVTWEKVASCCNPERKLRRFAPRVTPTGYKGTPRLCVSVGPIMLTATMPRTCKNSPDSLLYICSSLTMSDWLCMLRNITFILASKLATKANNRLLVHAVSRGLVSSLVQSKAQELVSDLECLWYGRN